MNIFSQVFSFIPSMYRWLKHYARAHKIISSIALVVLLGAGWYVYGAMTSTAGETRYVLGTASTSTIIAVVSESGQVSATDQVDITPKASGTITWVGVKAGDTVSTGQALVSIDSTDAAQAVTNAKIALESEQLTLSQDTEQAPIDYQKTQDAVTQAQQDLADEYDATYTTVANAFTTLPQSISTADSLIHGFDFSPNYENEGAYEGYFIASPPSIQDPIDQSATKADQDYTAARAAYTTTYADYKAISRSSSPDQIEAILNETYATAKSVSQSINSDVNLIDSTVDALNQRNTTIPTTVTSQQTSAHSALNTANSLLTQLSSEVKSLQSAKTALTTAQQALQLASIGNTDGSNPFSLQLEQNAVEQKQAALTAAEQTLADDTVRAPFAGVLSAVSAQVGDTAGSGALATIITNSQIAEVSVNEVDAAKIAVGQKVTLTFDAIDGLTLTGTVAEIDTVGTVSQGVVSYDVKITFDTQDDRVKPGMTVNADIQSAVHQDVLTVPSSAIKTVNGASFVQVFDPPLADTGGTQGVVSTVPPVQVPVETGISDDTNVEILSGLTAGEQVVTRTTTGTPTTATAARTTTGATGAAAGGAARGGAAGGFGGGGAAIRL